MVKFKKNIIKILLAIGVVGCVSFIGYSSLHKDVNNEEYKFQEVRDELIQEKLYMNKLNAERKQEEAKNKKPIEEEVKEEVKEEVVEEEVIEEEVIEEEVVYEEPVVYEEEVVEEEVYVEPPYVAPTYTPYTIGINGDYRSFVDLGYTRNKDYIQGYLNAGNITASTTPFIPNDGQTTYFCGHNPGIFNYMANSIYEGAIITVVDGNGTPYDYRITDYAYVDTKGLSVLNSIGKTVIDCYNYGSGEESIIIQYCLSGTMIAWYGTII